MIRIHIPTMRVCRMPKRLQQIPFDWIGPHDCYIPGPIYDRWMLGEDLERLALEAMVSNQHYYISDRMMATQYKTARYLIKCLRERRVHLLGVFIKHLVGDGDNAVACRVVEFLGPELAT